MSSIFITGSNRGLGLEWVRQCANDGWRVFASCRHPAEALELKRMSEQYPAVSIHRLDVTIAEDIRAITWEMEGEPIDILLSNAGVYLEKGGLNLAVSATRSGHKRLRLTPWEPCVLPRHW